MGGKGSVYRPHMRDTLSFFGTFDERVIQRSRGDGQQKD